ncbi:dipeptide ABC transporter ATP-binding protein [Ruania albidiflava]|uniref:dipeptide ABC transporter ATP-binding protein n=1 Tax=Ruania albidiflava TaxID=366586 RepID=UPI00146A0873|nr:ABC transporter ATP-binding protein [Ruania albidiflava]
MNDLNVGFALPHGITQVVHSLNLAVPHQGALAVVGESGSGKSVSMRSLLGLLPGTAQVSGSAVLTTGRGQGRDLLAMNESTLRQVRGRQVGMVFQNAMEAFNPSVPLGRQLTQALLWHDLCDRKTAQQRAIQTLADVGIPEPERRMKMYPFQLSGGMRQRAMIAMATIARPQLIIADEPTTALDVTVQKQILDLLVQLREAGMAMIMITHDLGVARHVCDEAVVLRHGTLIERSGIMDLLTGARDPYSRTLVDAALDVGVEPPTAEASAAHAGAGDGGPLLRVQNLTKVFGSRGGHVLAVDDVSFTLRQGRTLGVVGESGSGKSTLARMVLHLIEPTSGTVHVNGSCLAEVGTRTLRRMRKDMQMVFQSPYGSLLPSATVSENIGEPLRINRLGDKNERRTRASELLRLVELDAAYLDMYPRQLSGGQQQRVAIARALALEPTLLVADEPTSALDASVQVQVLDLLHGLQERLGFAMVLITHNLAVAERLAHEVMVMQHGAVREYAPTAQLFRSPQDDYTRNLLAAVLPVRTGLDGGPDE